MQGINGADAIFVAGFCCFVGIVCFPTFGFTILVCEVAFLIAVSFWPNEWLINPPQLFRRGKSKQEQLIEKEIQNGEGATNEEPLSPEEAEAVAAAKRIVANARAKFLEENGGFVPMASHHVQQLVDEAALIFAKNLDPLKSAEGESWVSQYTNKDREIEIFSATFPGHPCKRWKVEAVLETDLETAYDAMFVPEKRRKWDALVKDIRMLQINDCPPHIGDGLAITSIVTNAVLMVSSRSMLDLALQRCQKRGGITIANVSCPVGFEEAKMDPGSQSTVRATTHIGSGASIEAIPGRPGMVKYVLVSTIELGGWLPPSVINATMTMSLAQSTEQMQDYLKILKAEKI